MDWETMNDKPYFLQDDGKGWGPTNVELTPLLYIYIPS